VHVMRWSRDSGSFRDPAGFVFHHEGNLYRQVNASFANEYRSLIDSGLYTELVRDGLLIPHEETDLRLPGAPPAHAVLRPLPVPFISYPYEWCFRQYKAAALLTLEIQTRAIDRGLILRDASAYNVQFVGCRPILVDTLSFGKWQEGRPWAAYRQFCMHFLAPLACMAGVDALLARTTRIHVDGIPLGLAARLLPGRTKLRPGLLMHLHLHASRDTAGDAPDARAATHEEYRRMSRRALLGLVESLKRTVDNLSWRPSQTLWSAYMGRCSYTPAALQSKRKLVAEWLDAIAAGTRVRSAWDFGTNTGMYSRIAAGKASYVVALDSDHDAVERQFDECLVRGDARILPLVQDLANPSPALGWHHRERRSLAERGPCDVGLALAIVHHLAVGANAPLELVAELFHDCCRHLIVEFVPKEDPQVTEMLALRGDVFENYSQPGFERAFQPYFYVEKTARIEGTVRDLYLMSRRRG
jgi:hypothetical protein